MPRRVPHRPAWCTEQATIAEQKMSSAAAGQASSQRRSWRNRAALPAAAGAAGALALVGAFAGGYALANGHTVTRTRVITRTVPGPAITHTRIVYRVRHRKKPPPHPPARPHPPSRSAATSCNPGQARSNSTSPRPAAEPIAARSTSRSTTTQVPGTSSRPPRCKEPRPLDPGSRSQSAISAQAPSRRAASPAQADRSIPRRQALRGRSAYGPERDGTRGPGSHG